MTQKSRTDRRRIFKLGSKVSHVTRHAQQLFKVKRSKVKVTLSRDVLADKNAITRQCMVISTSNLVGIIARRYIDVLPDLLHSYNHTYHRSIGMAPVEVRDANEHLVRARLYPLKPKSYKWQVEV